MAIFNTSKERLNIICTLTEQLGILNNITEDSKALQSLKSELESRLDFASKKHQWLFNFQGGGWNSVSAYDKESAIELAKSEYSSPVDPDSFRLSTPSDLASCLSLFY